MECINGCTRLNQPTIELLQNRNLIRSVRRALSRGESKRYIARTWQLNWRQTEIIINYIRRKEVETSN